jgi:hypothetical protein
MIKKTLKLKKQVIESLSDLEKKQVFGGLGNANVSIEEVCFPPPVSVAPCDHSALQVCGTEVLCTK